MHHNLANAKKTSMVKRTKTTYLRIDVAFSQIHMIVVNILRPVTSELGNTYLKPRFHVPIIVYNSRLLDISLVDIGVVAKT